jgi:NOL1/NOP2/fmu family ribosome biogenesis protein
MKLNILGISLSLTTKHGFEFSISRGTIVLAAILGLGLLVWQNRHNIGVEHGHVRRWMVGHNQGTHN